MSICNSKILIAMESSHQTRISSDVSTTNLSSGAGNISLRKAAHSTKSAEKRTTSDTSSTNLPGGPMDSLVQSMLPVSRCNISLGKVVDSTEISSEILAIILREEMK